MNRLTVSIILLGLMAGCGSGGSDQPPVGHVVGQVIVDGRPLEGATVFFRPENGGKTSEGITDADGKYELTYLREVKGAIVGPHLVRITTFQEPVMGDNGKVEQPGRREEVAAEFNENSTLKVEVTEGENTLDFKVRGR